MKEKDQKQIHLHQGRKIKKKMPKKLTLEKFIEKAKSIHGDEYDYSLAEYKGCLNKVKIICKKHGVYFKSPNNHLSGQGCPICSNRFSYDTDEFIKRAKKAHGDKYDYSTTKYINKRKKVKIICKIHGDFEQFPRQHINGSNCPRCSGKFSYDTDEFIKKAKEVHGDKYDYSITEYKGSLKKVDIICPAHGVFKQIANNHISISNTNGCPKCNSSKGEILIENFLSDNNIKFQRQKTFNNCKNIRMLPFDFYLIDYDILIEYDGKQHFKAVEFFGGEDKFKKTLKNDKIKNIFCIKQGKKLIRINKLKEIEEKITGALNEQQDKQ